MSAEDVNDGVGRYASRSRINRRVLTLTGDGSNSISGSLDLNGKIARIILDPKDISCNANAATTGSLAITMDVSPTSAAIGYSYCDTIAALDVRSSSNTALHFQSAEGGNQGTANAKCGLHFTVTAPTSATTGGVTINEPAPWNGLVCGKVTFTLATSNGIFSAGTVRIIVIHE